MHAPRSNRPHRLRAAAAGLALLGALASGAACRPGDSPGTAGAPEQARRTVQAFFAAIANRDCAAVNRILGGNARARFLGRGGCKALFSSDQLAEATLARVEAPRQDGRDPLAVLVPVVLVHEGKRREALLRLRWSGGRYRLMDM